MKTSVTAGLDDKMKEEVRHSFVHSAVLRTQLRKVLAAKVKAAQSNVRSKEAYQIANWAYLQADCIGYERAMQEVIGLLTHDNEPEIEAADAAEISATLPKRPRGRPRTVKRQEN